MLQCSENPKSTVDVDIEAQKVVSEASNSDGTLQIAISTTSRTRRKNPGEISLPLSFSNGKAISGLRKSMRPRVISNKNRSSYGSHNTKGPLPKSRSRRHVFKKEARRLATSPALIRLRNCVFHENVWYHVGDIVSLLDVDGDILCPNK
ncbi:unnamed protein product, partial [Heterobilharzia americana]